MSLAAGIMQMGRTQAEALMESTCVIARAGAVTTDPATGVDSSTPATIYTGACRLRFPDARSTNEVAAGQAVAVQAPILSIPVTATGSSAVHVDDIATITLADSSTVTARIAGLHAQTHQTARRFPVEVTS